MRSLWHYLKARPVPRSDDDLLGAFVRERSEAAFTDLVERHGGMVLGVCRRVLGHSQDAEDAYQAAFLVLARKAPGLRGSGPLGPWLYGVARRVALKALSRRPRAQVCLDAATTAELLAIEEESAVDLAEVRPILDAEVARLPRKYRHALILCQLEGQTKAEAARQLGCPEGTVSSRLMRAKELLRARLVKRGIVLSSLATLDVLLAPPAASAALVHTTVQSALVFGTALTAGVVSPSVLSLTQGVTQAMFLTKVKMLAAGLVVIAGMSLGAGYVTGGGQDPGKSGGGPPAGGGSAGQAAKSKVDDKSAPKDEAPPMLEPDAIRKLLAKPTDKYDKRFGESFPLFDHLEHLEKVFGFSAQIDVPAYQEIDPARKLEDVGNVQIAIPKMRGEPVGAVLDRMLEGMRFGEEPVPSTYMIRRRSLVIVPKAFVKQAAEKLDVALEAGADGMTLVDALEQLATDTGVSIVIDPRAMEKARQTQIRSSIRNVRLLSAVRMIANMADLSVMNVDGALYVTDALNAAKLQAELDGNPLVEPLRPGFPPEGPAKTATPGAGGDGKTAPAKTPPSGKAAGGL